MVLIEDHAEVSAIVAKVLSAHDQIEVVAIAGTCAAGLIEVERRQPDVCLLDQRLPDGPGTDLLPRLRGVSLSTKVLLMTGNDNGEVLAETLRGGGVGVLVKGGVRASAIQAAVLEAAASDRVEHVHAD